MSEELPFKRLMLRPALRHLSLMVIRVIAVSDQMDLPMFNDVFCTMLGWSTGMGYILRIHGQKLNSFRRKTRARALHEFKLHRLEKFLFVSDTVSNWEWDVQVLDIEDGTTEDKRPVCLSGRGATPPEFCGGPMPPHFNFSRALRARSAAVLWRCASLSIGQRTQPRPAAIASNEVEIANPGKCKSQRT